MLLHIPDVLTKDELAHLRDALDQAPWGDGRETVGHQGAQVKRNEQLPDASPLKAELGRIVLAALERNPLFFAAALPAKILPPRFNRYAGGGTYGDHIDNAVFSVPGTPHRIRADLSATLFFCEPDEYEGGELVVQDSFGSHRAKLPAGHLLLYPSGSLHRVEPVTRGVRLAAFFWVQSLVREESQRGVLLELDDSIQALRQQVPGSPELVRLSGVYHNLLRQWSQT